MKIFLKIGLPWALSLGLVFFLGLNLGSTFKYSDQNETPAFETSEEINQVSNTIIPQKEITIKTTPSIDSNQQVSTPPMPPNLQRIMQGGDIVERLGTYLDAVRSMDRSNVKMVVKAFEELPRGYGRHLEMKLLMRSWANFDPEGALAYASNSLDAKSERRFGISEALAGWAVKDEKAAIAWAHTNHSGSNPNDNPLLVGIVKGLMETDLAAANRLFLGLPKGTARWQASSLLAEKFAQEDTQKAIQWAEDYPSDDPRMRETILGQMSAKLARQDLAATAKWAKSMKDEPGAYRVLENLINQWVEQNANEVATWINELEDSARKEHAMSELCARWSITDPVATAKWLNTQPPSPMLDPAISRFVERIQGRDPKGAADWAQTISDPLLKEKSLNQALDIWLKTNPEEAEDWMKKQRFKKESF